LKRRIKLGRVSVSVLAVGGIAVLALSCTAFVAAQLNGYEGPGPTTGGCFLLPSNACGKCIAERCENPQGDPPVSLQQVCTLKSSSLPYNTQRCANDPSITNSGYDNCDGVFLDGGTYASTIDTQGTAENNVRKCITDNCFGQCRICNATVYPCSSDTLDLPEAGACGACLYNAMNELNGPCELQAIDRCTYVTSDVASCAIPPGYCNTADCSNLQSPPSNFDTKTQSLLACLWTACQSSCQ
jgi:hypothetical protein